MDKRNNLLKWFVAIIIVVAATSIVIAQNYDNSSISQKDGKKESSNQNIANDTIPTFEAVHSPYIKEYSLPDDTLPNGILVGRDGTVWVAGSTSHTLTSFDPKSGKIKSAYEIKENDSSDNKSAPLMVWSIIEDNENTIWFSQMGKNPLWQFNPETEKFTAYHSISAAPFQMKVDKRTGNIWFTTLTSDTLGVIQRQNQPQSYKITEFNVGTDTYPSGLQLQNKDVWITQIQGQKLAKFSIVTDKDRMVTDIKKVLEIPQNNQTKISSPTDILISDGSIWITEHGASFLTRYHTHEKKLERFPTAVNSQHSTTLPFWIRQSLDGSGMWFNEHTGNRIGFFDTKNMTLSEYEIPTRPADGFVVYPLNIALDPNDNNKLWFSEWNTNKFGVLDTSIQIPFNIKANSNEIVINPNQTTELVFEITKTANLHQNNSTISFMASSSMMSNSELANMTVKFFPPTLNMSEFENTSKIRLVLESNGTQKGDYMLGIGATDGSVTKSVFLTLRIS
jgi:streptogramin lyase